MAQRGSGRSGGNARPAGRGSGGRNSSGGRGSAQGGRSSKQTSVAAQRAIKGARGRSGSILRVGIPVAVVVIVAAAVIVGVVLTGKHNSAASGGLSPDSDRSTAILANTAHQATGNTVDGVQSNSAEQLIYHIHAHLAMYVNGTQKLLPYGVGIVPPYQLQQGSTGSFVAGGSKFYWLHTHDETGVIHIETPAQHTYTLGNFFDLWGQPLTTTQIGPSKGKITAFINGNPYTGDPRNIPLTAHNVIQLDLGTVVPFSNFTFPQGE
jgi:hypothetical protein